MEPGAGGRRGSGEACVATEGRRMETRGWKGFQREGGLAGWLHRLEHRCTHREVSGSTPGQGMCLGCRFSSWLGVPSWGAYGVGE